LVFVIAAARRRLVFDVFVFGVSPSAVFRFSSARSGISVPNSAFAFPPAVFFAPLRLCVQKSVRPLPAAMLASTERGDYFGSLQSGQIV
jgi:hypothetical protein